MVDIHTLILYNNIQYIPPTNTLFFRMNFRPISSTLACRGMLCFPESLAKDKISGGATLGGSLDFSWKGLMSS